MFKIKLLISQKLLAAFGVMLLLNILLSVFVINQMDQINSVSQTIKDKWIPAIIASASLNDKFNAIRIGTLEYAFTPADSENRAAFGKDINDDLSTLDKMSAAFEPYGRIPNNKEIWAKTKERMKRHNTTLAQMIKEVEAGNDAKAQELALLVLSEQNGAARGLLDNLVALNASLAKDETKIGDKAFNLARIWVSVAAIICAVLTILLTTALTIGISRPLKKMTGTMKALAQGDTSSDIPALERHDEIGDMAQAVQVFKDNMIKADQLDAENQRAQTERLKRAENIAKLTQHFDQDTSETIGHVSAAASHMRNSSSSLSSAATQATRQSQTVANAARQAADNVQTVTAAAEELKASISQITMDITRASHVSEEAVQQTQQTRQIVNTLQSEANKIGEVVQLINEIADQTNMLALNATIEAARAGESGKGFAVVASEVKNLATQTTQATTDIVARVEATRAATQNAVEAIGAISHTIHSISEIAASIASAVEEQEAATGEIARNILLASDGTNDVTSNIEDVSKAVIGSGSIAQEVLEAADRLAQQSDAMRAQIQGFVQQVKTA